MNVTNIFLACKYAMPYLRQIKGNVINTASAGRPISFPNAVAYGASKGAVVVYKSFAIIIMCICTNKNSSKN